MTAHPEGIRDNDIDNARRMLLIPRAEWCVKELRRSAAALAEYADSVEIEHAAEGTGLMADTLNETLEELRKLVKSRDWLVRSSRFLLDMLTESNETVDALYGRSDTLENASNELRAAIADADETR